MEVAYRSETLNIIRLPAVEPDGRVILGFNGTAFKFGGMESTEFARSLAAAGVRSEILFFTDLTRSWYNTPVGEILAFLEQWYPRHNYVTLGNSMGGFGALLFSRLLAKCELAMSFCPQYSVHARHMPGEDRWLSFVEAVEHWPHPVALPEDGHRRARQYVFFGTADVLDQKQMQAMQGRLNPGAGMFAIDGCGHGVARYLKGKGLLSKLLLLLLGRDATISAVSALLTGGGVDWRLSTEG